MLGSCLLPSSNRSKDLITVQKANKKQRGLFCWGGGTRVVTGVLYGGGCEIGRENVVQRDTFYLLLFQLN